MCSNMCVRVYMCVHTNKGYIFEYTFKDNMAELAWAAKYAECISSEG